MTIARKLIYAASNGDNGFLCVGKNPSDVIVLHEPNGPSGGRPSRVELSTFLSFGADCPERLPLLGVIDSLVAASSATRAGVPVRARTRYRRGRTDTRGNGLVDLKAAHLMNASGSGRHSRDAPIRKEAPDSPSGASVVRRYGEACDPPLEVMFQYP